MWRHVPKSSLACHGTAYKTKQKEQQTKCFTGSQFRQQNQYEKYEGIVGINVGHSLAKLPSQYNCCL